MGTIYFLEAAMPLVKGYTLNAQNELKSTPYPHAAVFKSHTVACSSLKDFYQQLVAHAKLGHCLLKGKLHRTLNWESRAGSTQSNDTTDWVCFDLDGAPFKTPDEFMSGHPLLKDVSYVVQYSASHGLGKPGLRCHIFMLLDTPYNVAYLKSWLMSLNLDGKLWAGAARRAITLSNSKGALHWPIDITTCQNDKLLFIAPPVIGKGVTYVAPNPAIQIVAKSKPNLDTKLLGTQSIELWRKEQRALLNALRKEQGIETVRPTRIVGQYEVQGKPGEATITECWEDTEAGFVRFNLNGGDSNAYYHPLDNFEYIHNFKGEPSYLTKELLPSYYADCVAKAKHDATQPTQSGEIVLGVCDKRSSALWKISWNDKTENLQLYPARNDKQLADWLMQHGKAPGDFTPQWTFDFNPQSDVVVDLDAQYLNTYVRSPYYKAFKPTATMKSNAANADANWPTIKRIVMSMVSLNEWTDVTEHFMNWLAVIFQKKIKTKTAWLVHGVEGTGKGFFCNNILRPLLGKDYVIEFPMSQLEDKFNGRLERAQIVFIDEVEIGSSLQKSMISGTLRNWITEPRLNIRNMLQSAYEADNYSNFILASNKRGPVIINSEDRRYNVGEYQPEKIQLSDKEIDTLIPKELPHFFNYLMTREADAMKARTVIQTQSRKDVIDDNRNSVDMIADALLDGDMSPLVEALPDITLLNSGCGQDSALAVAYDTIIRRELKELTTWGKIKDGMRRHQGKLSRDELFVLFQYCIGGMPDSPAKFTRMLKYKNIVTKRMRSAAGDLCYGITVDWVASVQWCNENKLETIKPMRRVK